MCLIGVASQREQLAIESNIYLTLSGRVLELALRE